MKLLGLPHITVLLALLLSTSVSHAAGAAFHYKLDLTARLITTGAGELTAVQMSWVYDPELSATLLDGEDLSPANRDATLKKRAKDILDGLKGVGYFTKLRVDGKPLPYNEVTQYDLDLTGQSQILLNLTLPVTKVTPIKGHVFEMIVSDTSAVGLATFVDASNLKLDEPLSSGCQAPRLVQSQDGIIDEHPVISETMTVDCR